MSYLLRLGLDVQSTDTSVGPSSFDDVLVQDGAPGSTHDYVDPTPLNVATGNPGTTFVQVATSVAQIERVCAQVPLGADVVFRFGGAPASVVGSVAGTIAPAGTETLVFSVDSGSNVTASFTAGDTWIALAAKRINYAAGAQIASVDPATGCLRLTGLLTGGADAKAKNFAYGAITLVSGTGLALLGLTAGTTFGKGDDERVGQGPFAKTFPPSSLPARLEVSGTAQNTKFWVAGKAS